MLVYSDEHLLYSAQNGSLVFMVTKDILERQLTSLTGVCVNKISCLRLDGRRE